MPAGGIDASALVKLAGAVDVGRVDVAADVEGVDVASATDETGTTEFS